MSLRSFVTGDQTWLLRRALLPSRTSKGGTYGVLWVINKGIGEDCPAGACMVLPSPIGPSTVIALASWEPCEPSACPADRFHAGVLTEITNRAAVGLNGQIRHSDPKHPLEFRAGRFRDCWTERSLPFPVSVYIIESLFPDGWREQSSARVEYWACHEAQARCCSDGRNTRVIDSRSNEIVALIDTSSCRLVHSASR